LGEILPLENPKEWVANPTKVFVGSYYILDNFFLNFPDLDHGGIII
jgi:hypothetical protein